MTLTSETASDIDSAVSAEVGVPPFAVIGGHEVDDHLAGNEAETIDLIRRTYLLHDAGQTVNPPSYFLRFPDRPDNRIIALPASVGGSVGIDGVKWISSVPGNVAHGVPRASAVTIINDPVTGYPLACIESAIISATRTAASAALAAVELRDGRSFDRVAVIGGGLIARYVVRYLLAAGVTPQEIVVHDTSVAHGASFVDHLRRTHPGTTARFTDDVAEAIGASDLVVFTTVAPEPYVDDPSLLAHRPLVLNLSLRDLGVSMVLAADNVVDDVDHCLKANTSVHLAEQQLGNRDFLTGTLAEVVRGTVTLRADRPTIFSPFGLGVLDLALAKQIYDDLATAGRLREIPDFYHDVRRLP